MDQTDRTLLNIIQSSFPMVEEPFRQIGEETGIPESEVISRIAASKEKNIVRQIGAIFDTRKLGYKTVLVAMRLPPDGLDSGARVINEHPGVSHNYARNGPFNLWFTLAVPPEDSLEDTVEQMAGRAGAESYRLMPTIRFFKIGVNFDMVKRGGSGGGLLQPRRLRQERRPGLQAPRARNRLREGCHPGAPGRHAARAETVRAHG